MKYTKYVFLIVIYGLSSFTATFPGINSNKTPGAELFTIMSSNVLSQNRYQCNFKYSNSPLSVPEKKSLENRINLFESFLSNKQTINKPDIICLQDIEENDNFLTCINNFYSCSNEKSNPIYDDHNLGLCTVFNPLQFGFLKKKSIPFSTNSSYGFLVSYLYDTHQNKTLAVINVNADCPYTNNQKIEHLKEIQKYINQRKYKADAWVICGNLYTNKSFIKKEFINKLSFFDVDNTKKPKIKTAYDYKSKEYKRLDYLLCKGLIQRQYVVEPHNHNYFLTLDSSDQEKNHYSNHGVVLVTLYWPEDENNKKYSNDYEQIYQENNVINTNGHNKEDIEELCSRIEAEIDKDDYSSYENNYDFLKNKIQTKYHQQIGEF